MITTPSQRTDCANLRATGDGSHARNPEALPTGAPAPESFVRTILRMRAVSGSERAFESAAREAMEEIRGIRGSVRQDLMRDLADPRTYLIVGDWSDRATLDAFGRSAGRERLLARVRDLRESAERATYEVLHSVTGQPDAHTQLAHQRDGDGGEFDQRLKQNTLEHADATDGGNRTDDHART